MSYNKQRKGRRQDMTAGRPGDEERKAEERAKAEDAKAEDVAKRFLTA